MSQTGVISSLEIHARANDYPLASHPMAFHLFAEEGNYIDLRQQEEP
jgi:hypothetical protein